ncbi:MAG: hypothetical protein ACRENP_03330 [Longimicrobiales bacterium]
MKAQRVLYPARIRYSKLGVTGLASVVALLLIVAAGWILELRGEREDVRSFGAWAEAQKLSPIDALVEAARSHRILFLSDIYGSIETKRLAADAVEAIANGPGLDALVVEVGHDQQPYLDRYFDRSPEDASVLLSRPRTLRESGPGARAYVDLYHRIWQLNQKLGADRRIQVIAADLDNWPPTRAVSTADRARRFSERGQGMMRNLEQEVLNITPRARVLVFMSGLQALKTGTGQLQTGGTSAVNARWLATYLEQRFPGEVHSAVVDAPGTSNPEELVSYIGTRLPLEAESVLPRGRYALPVTSAFDFLSQPIRRIAGPGLTFDLLPRQYRLKDVVDAYIHLGN